MELRELTKSTISFTWAMSLFGLKQAVNVVQPKKAAESFNTIAGATQRELGKTLDATYRVGETTQRGLVDLVFNILTLQVFNPSGGRASSGCGSSSGRSSDRHNSD